MDADVITALIGVVATSISGGIGVLVVWLTARNSDKRSEKQHQVQGLLEAFKLLDSPEHRESREKIFKLYFEFLKKYNLEVFNQAEVGNIMADFDVIGKLVKSNNISKNDFLNVYGSLIYRCWKILELHVKQERKSSDFPKFMSNFQTLAEEGYAYWDKKEKYDINKTRLYNPDNRNDSKTFEEIKTISEELEEKFRNEGKL